MSRFWRLCSRCALFTLLTMSMTVTAPADDALPIRQRLQPVAKASGLHIDGYFVWCGSALKVDQTYHLFASRWPESTGFPEGYRTHSEIVRATASRPEGPYTFQEVVLTKRDPQHWDSGMQHNPVIYRVGATFALFYNASAEGARYRQLGVATADRITGPWQRRQQPLDLGVATDANNPAACIAADGSLKLIWRDSKLRVFISAAPSVQGPYKVINDNVWPTARIEDFFLFDSGGTYHLVCEDNAGSITGQSRWGGHLQSTDALGVWQPGAPAALYDHEIRWDDGTSLHATRRERPWLLIEDGQITCLFTSVYDGQRTWNQAVPIRPPVVLQTP